MPFKSKLESAIHGADPHTLAWLGLPAPAPAGPPEPTPVLDALAFSMHRPSGVLGVDLRPDRPASRVQRLWRGVKDSVLPRHDFVTNPWRAPNRQKSATRRLVAEADDDDTASSVPETPRPGVDVDEVVVLAPPFSTPRYQPAERAALTEDEPYEIENPYPKVYMRQNSKLAEESAAVQRGYSGDPVYPASPDIDLPVFPEPRIGDHAVNQNNHARTSAVTSNSSSTTTVRSPESTPARENKSPKTKPTEKKRKRQEDPPKRAESPLQFFEKNKWDPKTYRGPLTPPPPPPPPAAAPGCGARLCWVLGTAGAVLLVLACVGVSLYFTGLLEFDFNLSGDATTAVPDPALTTAPAEGKAEWTTDPANNPTAAADPPSDITTAGS